MGASHLHLSIHGCLTPAPIHPWVEFDAISNRLVTVERRLVHDEATLTAPRPMAAPSQGPPRGGVPGGFSAPGGFGSRGGAAAPGGFGSRGGLNGARGGGADYGGAGAYPHTPLHHSMTPMHPSMTPAHPSMTPAAAPYTPMHAPTPTPGDDNDFMLGGASDYQVREGGVATCSWAQIDPHGQTCQCQSGSEKASQVGHMGWSLNAGWVMEPQIRVVQGESSHVGRRWKWE
eukprot:1160804-Pelagomonas_calceolata.AAC.34